MSFQNEREREQFDKAWDRLVRTAGGYPGGFSSKLSDGFSSTTSESLNIYVDQATGSDVNLGTVDSPLKTIQAAINKLPLTIIHPSTINIGPGTYDEALTLHNRLQATLTIQGTTWNAVVPATGIASGTFDASFVGQTLIQSAVVTGAGWTVNDLRGKFCYVPSLSQYFPIASNTATTMDFPIHVSATSGPGGNGGRDLRGLAFQIVSQAAIIQNTLTNNSLTGVKNILYVVGTASASASLTFTSVYFKATTIVVLGNIRLAAAITNLTFSQCRVEASVWSSTAGVSGGIQAYSSSFVDCFSGGLGAWQAGAGGQLTVSSTVFDGSFHSGGTGLAAAPGGSVGFRGIIQNLSGVAIFGDNGSKLAINAGAALIRNCGTGVLIGSGSTLTQGTASAQFIIDTCTIGIEFGASFADYSSSNAWIAVSIIQNCGTGIKFGQHHAGVYVSDASSIINSTGIGVDMCGVKRSAFNQFAFTSAFVMSGNVGGDIKYGTATITTIAALRADPDKDLLDPIRLNRVMED